MRLTGGFAFETWWQGPNNGQFVITVGGYHPRFHHDGYPVVPRVGLSWQPIDDDQRRRRRLLRAVLRGDHGRRLDGGRRAPRPRAREPALRWRRHRLLRPVLVRGRGLRRGAGRDHDLAAVRQRRHRRLARLRRRRSTARRSTSRATSACAASASRSSSATRRTRPTGRWTPTSSPTSTCAAAPTPRSSRPRSLRGGLTAGKSAAAGSGGVDKPPDGSAENPFRLVPEFRLTFVTTAPAETLQLTCAAGSKDTTVSAPGLGVAPMYSATLDTTLTVSLTSDDGQVFDISGVLLTRAHGRGVPEGRLGTRAEPEGQDGSRRRHHRRLRRPDDRHGPARQPVHRGAADRLPPDRAAARRAASRCRS